MPLTEFTIIDQFFQQKARPAHVCVGVGDDAAVVSVPSQQAWVTSIDTLVQGVHFLPGVSAEDLGHKALAVSLSDLAAMGAVPNTALLSLTLPEVDEKWLAAFCRGFFALAAAHEVSLIGGDTTRGPLSVSVVANGLVPPTKALRRDGAKVGDAIYVTGTVGDAGAALKLLQTGAACDAYLQHRLDRPTPRVQEGEALRQFAHAAIDISDGLVADTEKLAAASGVGALIYAEALPLSPALTKAFSRDEARQLALSAGDDYELCFTIPRASVAQCEAVFADFQCGVHCIGEIVEEKGVRVLDENNEPISIRSKGYVHFESA